MTTIELTDSLNTTLERAAQTLELAQRIHAAFETLAEAPGCLWRCSFSR